MSAVIFRKGLDLKGAVAGELAQDYRSPLIDALKAGDYTYRSGRLTVRLAHEFGFCYGVDRAVDLAYETVTRFPDRPVYLTNEIIHNPRVNAELSFYFGVSGAIGFRPFDTRDMDWVGGRTGVCQRCERLNFLQLQSHLQRVVSPLSASQENFEARALHSTHLGRLCPIETPEGTNIGLRKNMALLCSISQESPEDDVVKVLKDNGLRMVK